MQKVIYLKGLPASGKTMWATDYISTVPNVIRVCRDNIRKMLICKYELFPFGGPMEKLVTDIENNSIHCAIERGYTVIVDATNFRFTEAKRKQYEEALGIPVEIVDFTDVPLETCIKRDEEREKTVGRNVIISMCNKYLKFNGE